MGFFVQSTHGWTGNFEVVVPRRYGGADHMWRANDDPALRWSAPAIAFGSPGDIGALSLIQSRFGAIANLEIVGRQGDQLVHAWRDDGGSLRWMTPAALPGHCADSGSPAFVQRGPGPNDNFEVLAPLPGGGLGHWWRDNAAPGFPWHGPLPVDTGVVDSVELIFSTYGNPEAVLRVGDHLEHWWFGGGAWHGPLAFAWAVSGRPGFVQSRHGATGNFEVVAPLADGGMGHWWRDNDDPALRWHGPVRFGAGDPGATSVVHSTYGNLEVVAAFADHLEHWWRDDGGTWAWAGPTVFAARPVSDPPVVGATKVALHTGVVGIHSALLHTGRVVFFGLSDFDPHAGASALVDPTSGAVQHVHAHHVPFCSGHAFLGDGRLLVAGGHDHDVHAVHTFDPATQTWHREHDMHRGRWYPTCTPLSDGAVLVISGSAGVGAPGPDNQVTNTLQVFHPASGLGPEEDLPVPFSHTFPPELPTIDLYPFVYTLPAGNVLVHSRQTTRFYDPRAHHWDHTELAAHRPVSRSWPGAGTSVMLPLRPTSDPPYRVRVVVIGGGGADGGALGQQTPATATAEVLDLAVDPLAWRPIQPMAFARVMPDAVLLPDGSVVVVGGSATGRADMAIDPVLPVEHLDPGTLEWSTLCDLHVPRLYHSCALLLPDATVLVVGKDGHFNPDPYHYPEHRAEVFLPPYCFRGPRPRITSAPGDVGYHAPFVVGVADPASVDAAVLIRPASVTHSFQMDQRFVGLTIAGRSTVDLTLEAPPDAHVAPPGYYMLFLVNRAGVPSIARFVHLG